MKGKLWLLVALMFCLALPIIYAVSPFTPQTSTGALTIVYPQLLFHPQHHDIVLSFDVLNSTNSRINGTEANCIFVSVDNHGIRVANGNLTYSPAVQYWVFNLNKTQTAINGFYNFYTYCNTTYEGGFVSLVYEITDDGLDSSVLDSTSGISITLFILSICAVLFITPFVVKFHKNPIPNLVIGRSLHVVAVYLMMLNSAVLSTISNVTNLGVDKELFRYMWLFGVAGYILMGLLVFRTFLEVIGMWKHQINDKREGNEYDDEDEY